MPEMRFTIRWPDGRQEQCYSPSLVIKEYFAPGETYPLDNFVQRSRTALTIASDRVKARYGFACSLAMGQLDRIETEASRFTGTTEPKVLVEAFEE
jgi:uncharacterized repeat protein (TIGR04042 family)